MTELEAIKARRSIRKYKEGPIPQEQVLLLQEKIRELNEISGLHMQLVLDHPETFRHFLVHYGGFRNAQHYVALVGKANEELRKSAAISENSWYCLRRRWGWAPAGSAGHSAKRKLSSLWTKEKAVSDHFDWGSR